MNGGILVHCEHNAGTSASFAARAWAHLLLPKMFKVEEVPAVEGNCKLAINCHIQLQRVVLKCHISLAELECQAIAEMLLLAPADCFAVNIRQQCMRDLKSPLARFCGFIYV